MDRSIRSLGGGVGALVLALSLFALGGAASADEGTLVKNTDQEDSDPISFYEDLSLTFTTGDDPLGYTLSAIEVGATIEVPQANPGSSRVLIYEGSGTNFGKFVGELNISTLQNGTNRYTGSRDFDLKGSTSYILVIDITHRSNQGPYLYATSSSDEDSGGLPNWIIGNQMSHKSERPSHHVSPQHPGRYPSWTAATHGNVVKVNIVGSAKTPPPSEAEAPSNDDPSYLYDGVDINDGSYLNDGSYITTYQGNEPGNTYDLGDGETRKVNDDGSYLVRRCNIYDRWGMLVETRWGGTEPCP